MSIIVTFNGLPYIIPETGEVGWGSNLDSYLVAIAAGSLQKTGGNFSLSSELDFGASYGLKSLYYSSRSPNVATGGNIRLANGTDSVAWRNAANTANLPLLVNGSDQLTFNGTPIGGAAIFTPSRAIVSDGSGNLTSATTTATEIGYVNGVTSSIQAQLNSKNSSTLTSAHLFVGNVSNVATDVAVSGDVHIDNAGVTAIQALAVTGAKIAADTITNTNINSAAAIAYSKLNLVGSVTNADLAGSISYSKLVLANSVVNADINSAAAIAYSKLNLATSIVNSDIGAAAAIAYSKLALSNSIVNADINSAAAIAYSKLNLTGNIVNADLSASAAIARSKIAAGTAWNTIVNDGSGNLTSVAPGLSGQSLVSNGATALPSYQTVAGSGTVNSGTQYQMAYYATSSNVVSGLAALTTDPAQNIIMLPTKALYLDGGYNTYLLESSSDNIQVYTGGTLALAIDAAQNAVFSGDVTISHSGSSTLFINSVANSPVIQLQRASTTKARIGLADSANSLCTGSVAGDLIVRTENQKILLTTDGGTTAAITIDTTSKTTHSGNIAFTTTSTQGIVGTTTNDSAAAGNVGEYVRSAVSLLNFPATTTYGDATSISLTAGDWLVSLILNPEIAPSVTVTGYSAAISTTPGNSTTGFVSGDNAVSCDITSGTHAVGPLTIASYRMSLSSTTTVYYKYRSDYPGLVPKMDGRISAVRIR